MVALLGEHVKGEWLLTASIMQCTDAVFGRIHLTENGDMVYLSGAPDLIGRGVGRWVSEGNVLGFQVDIYQYTLASTKHVHMEPHRFRAVAKLPQDRDHWTGEWYFCAHQQPPRLVGTFHAHRLPNGPPTGKKMPEMQSEAKRAVLAKLDKLLEPPPMAEPRWLKHHQPGRIQDVHYVRSFLEPKQVEEMERVIDKCCDWERMNTRDTQEFGHAGNFVCVALPKWQEDIVLALHNLGVFHPVLFPANSVRINAYNPGQGIHPHLDGPVYYPRAAIVTLGSHCVFDFYPRLDQDEVPRLDWDRDREVPASAELPPGTKPALSLLLEPGSLLVFSGDAFIHHRHGIAAREEDEIGPEIRIPKDIGLSPGDVLKRGRRVSLTVRHLLPRCSGNAGPA